MAKPTTADIDSLVDRGLQAVNEDQLDTADSLLDDARGIAGENHVRVLHLAGMLAWARGDLERANGYLMQAADMDGARTDLLLDCAECLFASDEIDEAEAQVRAALERDDLSREQGDDGRLLLAQIRLAGDDPDEALEVLGEIDPGLHGHPAFLSTRGAANMAAGKLEDAATDFKAAIELEGEDADLHYQLALVLGANGDREGSARAMVKVLELDATEDGPREAPSYAEAQELRTRLEEVLEQLPDPLLKLVASAPITVQGRATREQVEAGIDPRSSVCFQGKPKLGEDDDAELTGIVIMRDLLPEEATEDEDALEDELLYGVMEELQTFFKRDDLVVAEA